MKVQIFKCDNKHWTIVGSIIKLFQRTNYSHYAIGFQSHTGEFLVLDATSKNVATRHVHYYLEHYKIIDTYTVDIAFSYDDFCQWYEQLLGESYGFLQLIGILIRSKSLGKGIVCNELVLRMLRRFTTFEDDNLDIRDLNYTSQIIDKYKM